VRSHRHRAGHAGDFCQQRRRVADRAGDDAHQHEAGEQQHLQRIGGYQRMVAALENRGDLQPGHGDAEDVGRKSEKLHQ
jgi:hypothetical protein